MNLQALQEGWNIEMAIREIDPGFKIGPFKKGPRLGQEVTKGRYCDRYSDEIFEDHNSQGETESHSVAIFIHPPDKITVKGSDRPRCGECKQKDLIGEEINNHPLLASLLRWVPE